MNTVVKFPYSPMYRLYMNHRNQNQTYEEFLEWLVLAVIVDSEWRERVLEASSEAR